MRKLIIGRYPPSWGLRIQSVLRIVAGSLFMLHGTTKLFAFPQGMGPDHTGTATLWTQAWFAGLLEVVGGVFLLLGLFTRPIAFLVSGEMAVAYWQVHAPRGFWPTMNGGEAAALYCFVWLFYSAAGAGPWSLDAMLRSRRRHVPEHQDAPQFRAASNE
jgi:putative oxidoreductase